MEGCCATCVTLKLGFFNALVSLPLMFYDERFGSKPRYAVSGVPYSCSELWLTKVSKPGDSDILTDPMRKVAQTGI